MNDAATVNTDTVLEFNPGKLFKDFSKDEIATVCSMITERLRDKAIELRDLFQELRDTYPEFFCLADFSVICSISTETLDNPIILSIQGTPAGITRSAKNVIKALTEINNE